MDAGPPKKKLGGLEKVLLGCAVGCGVLIVAGLIAGGLGAFWFFTPGKQIATEKIVGAESVGVVRMNELATDAGTQALLTKVLTELNELNRQQQREALPEELRWLTRFQRSPRARDFNQFIPKEATLVLEPAAGEGETPFVAAVNFRTMVRPIKAMFAMIGRAEDREGAVTRHRGHEIYRLDDGDGDAPTFAFVGSTLLISNRKEALETAIDRIEGAVPAGAERLESAAPEGTWDATGMLANDDGAVTEVLSSVVDDPSLQVPGADGADLDLRFGLDVVSADEITARSVLDCGDPGRAAAWLAALEERFARLKERAADHGLTLDVDAVVRGRSVETEVRLTGLEAAIERAVRIEVSQPKNR